MSTVDHLPILRSYVPDLIVQRLAEKPNPITEATAERFPAAVLFADMAGFTQMAETMVQASDERTGAEKLARLLNDYFTQLIEIIRAHGGDVAKFAGDALLALWPAPSKRTGLLFDSNAELMAATHQAAHCGLAIQEKLHNVKIMGQRLTLQIGVCAGYVSAVHIGGVRGRWEFMLSSTPLVQATQAEEMAKPGEVVLSPDAWKLVAHCGTGRPLPRHYVRVTHMQPPAALPSSPPVNLKPQTQSLLERYIPAAVLPHLKAGHHDWVAEIRQVTVLFIHLPSFGTSIRHPYNRTLPRAQAIMHELQAALYRYEGSINKLNVDDKGITLVAALGLSPLSHEDDPVRGVQAAVEMQTAVREFGRPIAIGVTTGQLFCGPIGHPQRREYTMVGEAMNLASRLMEAAEATLAKKKGGLTPAILCDEATYLAAKARLVFDDLQPIQVKGKRHRIPIYRPRIRDGAAEQVPVWQRERPSHNRLVGRQAEWELLHQHMRALRSGQPPDPNLVVIEGDTGIGKSELLQAVGARARQLRLYTMSATVVDDPNKTLPFNGWRPIFEQLFGLEKLLFESQARQQAHILRQLPVGPEERGYPVRALQMAPLLNGVLPIALPDNALTRPLQDEARIRATHELLLRLLPLMIRKAKRTMEAAIILIDNGHLLDAASLALVQAMAQIDMPILIVIASKILPTPSYHYLQTAVAQHIRLGPLTAVDTQEIVRKLLGVARIAPEVTDIIQNQAEGHPFYSQAVLTALRQADQVQITRNECRLNPAALQQLTIPLPPDVQKVITYGVDRLSPRQQLLLKTAASLADSFTVAEITAVYPLQTEAQQMQTHLDELVTMGILQGEQRSATHYRFPFRLGREAVYQLLLGEQRGKLKGKPRE